MVSKELTQKVGFAISGTSTEQNQGGFVLIDGLLDVVTVDLLLVQVKLERFNAMFCSSLGDMLVILGNALKAITAKVGYKAAIRKFGHNCPQL